MQKTEAKPCPGTGEYQLLGQGASQYPRLTSLFPIKARQQADPLREDSQR